MLIIWSKEVYAYIIYGTDNIDMGAGRYQTLFSNYNMINICSITEIWDTLLDTTHSHTIVTQCLTVISPQKACTHIYDTIYTYTHGFLDIID